MKRFFPLLGLLLVTLGAGCKAHTIVTRSVTTPKAIETIPLLRMLVMGEHLGPNDRRTVEAQVAEALRKNGVDAHPGGELFPVPPTDHEATRAALVANGYDGALVVSLADVTSEQCGTIYVCLRPYRAGFMTDDRHVTIDSMLWDVRGRDSIVWRASTETMNPSDREDLALTASRAIVAELARTDFLLTAER